MSDFNWEMYMRYLNSLYNAIQGKYKAKYSGKLYGISDVPERKKMLINAFTDLTRFLDESIPPPK